MNEEPVNVDNYQKLELTKAQYKLLKEARKCILEYDPPVSNDIYILAHYGLLDCMDPEMEYHKKAKFGKLASFIITDIGIMYIQYRTHKHRLAYAPIIISLASLLISAISIFLNLLLKS